MAVNGCYGPSGAEIECFMGISSATFLEVVGDALAITSGLESLTVHAVVDDFSQGPAILEQVHRLLAKRFGLRHVTAQIEPPGFAPEADGVHRQPPPSLTRA